MSKDYNYWKNKYSFLWEQSSTREEMVKTIIEKETGMEVEYYGTGAGSTKFIKGISEEKGSPDLHIKGTDIFIEITGPISDKVKSGSPLWFRPDKLNYALNSRFNKNEFLVNNFKGEGIWYVIHFDDDTIAYAINSMRNNIDYKLIEPTIRGVKERYSEIDPTTKYVSNDLQSLIDYIISYKNSKNNTNSINQIKELRKKLHLTQKEFSKKYKIPLATVQDWENERTIPPTYVASLCLKIAKLEAEIEKIK